MSMPLLHVLVINWNGLEHLEVCFDSLLASDYPNVKLILVDNASEDDSVAFVRAHYGHDPRVDILVCPRNLGWSGGNNLAMERSLAAGADYLVLLNNDTWTAPDALRRLVAAAEARPEAGALAPKMVMFDAPDILNSIGLECSWACASWDRGIGRLDGPRWNEPVETIGACGGAVLLRAAALRKTGLLPDFFEQYLDDLDLCLRIWNAGYTIRTCPEAVFRHKFSATLGQGRRARHKYYLNTRNRLYLLLRNMPLRRFPQLNVAIVLGECRAVGRALLDGAPWRVWAHARAWAAGIAFMPRALATRFRQRKTRPGKCAFWPLMRRTPLYCPGFLMPEQGWYPEVMVSGKGLRPMSRHAWLDVDTGPLRLTHGNCYPRLGPTEIRVSMNGRALATLASDGLDETMLSVTAGRLEFEAGRIFDADETGALADLGGWIAVQPAD